MQQQLLDFFQPIFVPYDAGTPSYFISRLYLPISRAAHGAADEVSGPACC